MSARGWCSNVEARQAARWRGLLKKRRPWPGVPHAKANGQSAGAPQGRLPGPLQGKVTQQPDVTGIAKVRAQELFS